MRKVTLVEGRLEGLIMGVTEEAVEFPGLGGMRNGVPEIPVGTAVAGERFPVISWRGKIQVLLGWTGQEQRMVPSGLAMTMDRSFFVCTM